jgi:outer membrane protein TolC
MRRGLLLVWMTVVATAACSQLPYEPRPLDRDAAAADYAQRTAASDGLRAFAAANGYREADWPPREWGLRELTLAALYFHPDMGIARARAEVARAQQAGAGAPPPLSVAVRPEHHSVEQPENDSPWTLGLELEIPLAQQGRREARQERAGFLADAAEIDVASAAWEVRARVRDRLRALQASRENLAALDEQLAARREMLALVERRVQAGMLSSHEAAAERLAVGQLELARDEEAARARDGLADLASAVGVPPGVAQAMPLRFDAEPPPAEADAASLQRLALQNRLDVHRRLLEFGAADADVKLAVAEQNPQITLGPGYAWDQGDNVWSLAVGLTIPPAAAARAAVREREATRELAARQFLATQSAAILATEAAAAQYLGARERMTLAQRQAILLQEQEARMARMFDAGSADRMQRVSARLEALASQAALRQARAGSWQALARLEDAVQRPLSGDMAALPDLRAAKLHGSASPP